MLKKPPFVRTYLTEEQKIAFLQALSECGSVTDAAKIANVCRRSVYKMTDKYPDFKKKFLEAKETAKENLEGEAYRRAKVGWDEPVFYRGEQVGNIRKYSDLLLIFLLKALDPDKYRENTKVEIPGGVTVKIQKFSNDNQQNGQRNNNSK